jgi:hypothetical protein
MRHLHFFIFLLILTVTTAYTQVFTKTMLLTDLQYLNTIVTESHPTKVKYSNTNPLDSLISSIQQEAPETFKYRDYELYIRKALMQVQCMHTYITKPAKNKQLYYNFPVRLFASNDTLYIAESSLDSVTYQFKKGDIIESINGKSAKEIISNLIQYQPTDGKSTAFGYRLFNYNSQRLMQLFYSADSAFKVNYMHQTKRISENWSPNLKTLKAPIIKQDSALLSIKGNQSVFKLLPNNTGYLQISSFKKKHYKSFYAKVFNVLKEKNCSNLIIDLRDNLGGNRFNATELLSYVINESTSYDIIRPTTKLKKHLKFKERLKFASSFIFYDVMQLHSRSKTENGLVTFKCAINRKSEIFNGKIILLVNGYTGSSSVIVASNIKHHAKNVTLIGEQTAGGESSINGGSYPTLFLPQSKIGIQYATYFFQFDTHVNNRNGLIPNSTICYTYKTFLTTDLELQTALQQLKTQN